MLFVDYDIHEIKFILTSIPALISNYIHYNVRAEIT